MPCLEVTVLKSSSEQNTQLWMALDLFGTSEQERTILVAQSAFLTPTADQSA